MKKENNSFAERVYYLVKSLSPAEKKKILQLSKTSGKRVSSDEKAYIKLFSIYSSSQKFDAKKIQESFKRFGSSFKGANRYLRKLILEFLAISESHHCDPISVAKKAVQKGFPKYAQILLRKELDSAKEKNQQGRLVATLEQLEVVERYYLEHSDADPQTPVDHLYSDISTYIRSKQLALIFKNSLGQNAETRLQIADLFREELEEMMVESFLPKTQYGVLVAARNFYFLEGTPPKAKELQPLILEIIRKNPDLLPPETVINESHINIMHLMLAGAFEEAKTQLESLASKEYPEHLVHQVNKYWLIDSVFLAAASADFGYLPRAIRDYFEYEPLLSSFYKVRLAHAISVLYFHAEDWESAIEWQKKISGFPVRHKMKIDWLPFLVRAICQFEMGYLYESKKTIKKYFESQNAEKYTYPNEVLSSLEGIIDAQDNVLGYRYLFSKFQRDFKCLFHENEDFRFECDTFPLEMWLDSKVRGTSLMEIVRTNSQTGSPLFNIG